MSGIGMIEQHRRRDGRRNNFAGDQGPRRWNVTRLRESNSQGLYQRRRHSCKENPGQYQDSHLAPNGTQQANQRKRNQNSLLRKQLTEVRWMYHSPVIATVSVLEKK